ncbi:MAG: hypothetical protein ACJAQ6_000331 [Arenicella sp.]|jgi:hypothetical protein
MNQQLTDFLEQQLRPPQTPEAISWWPVAPGWWIVTALLIVLISYAVIKLRQHRTKNSYRKIAMMLLDWHYSEWQLQQNDGEYLQAANSVIKRACSHIDKNSRKLSGHDWVNYLNALCDNKLSQTTQSALGDSLYQRQPEANIDDVHQQLRAWLLEHDRRLISNYETALNAEPSNA